MFRVGVLVSGSGTNLQAIIDKVHGRDGIEVVGVVSNVAGAGALDRAAAAGIDTGVFERGDYAGRPARDEAIVAWLREREVELVVLAGYMELIQAPLLDAFPKRIINVHPSLLPAFPGATPIEDQIAAGTREGGVTVHYVDAGIDSGPILLQEAVELPASDDVDVVRERVHEVEHRLLPRAIEMLAHGS